MKRNMHTKRLCIVILCSLMCLSLPFSVLSAGFDVSKSKTADKTTLSPDDRETEVTLSLPSAEEKVKIDVVFVIDKSTSSKNSLSSFDQAAKDLLLNNLILKNVELKVGVIKFRGYSTDAVAAVTSDANKEMIVYSEETKDIITDALNLNMSGGYGNGTNLHGALRLADEWLSADNDVVDDNKYVIMLTDGKTYIWDELQDDGSGNLKYMPTTNYAQHYRQKAIQKGGVPQINQKFLYEKYVTAYYPASIDASKVVAFFDPADIGNSAKNFKLLYDSTDEELTAKTKYDVIAGYAYDAAKIALPGTINLHSTENGATVFPDAESYRTYYEFIPDDPAAVFLEANPFEVNLSEGKYTFDTSKINEDFYMYHVSSLEKGLYKASHLWSDMGSRYHCGAVYWKDWGSGGTGLDLAKGFCDWLGDPANSDFSVSVKTSTANNYDSFFNSINDEIRYKVAKGTIEDEIGEAFDLNRNGYADEAPFNMTVADVVLPCIKEGENKWNFGTDSGSGFPYVVSFAPETKTITWQINVPVKNDEVTKLSYKLILDLSKVTDGMVCDTNKDAELEYADYSGTIQSPESFVKPKITISMPPSGGGSGGGGTPPPSDDDDDDDEPIVKPKPKPLPPPVVYEEIEKPNPTTGAEI